MDTTIYPAALAETHSVPAIVKQLLGPYLTEAGEYESKPYEPHDEPEWTEVAEFWQIAVRAAQL